MPIRFYYILWTLIAIIYLCNLTIDVMEVDAAQYASMAAEMKATGSYLQVYHRGEDYLDKPPLLFWLSSASFSLFGVSNFSYKLPALLVLILGLWSTYRFTLMYQKKETALMATTILASTQAFFLMTNDVRTDGLLTGFVMFVIYQCAVYLRRPHWRYLVFAGVGVGLAMLAKGPIGAIIPMIAVGSDRILQGKWKELINAKWIIVIFVTLVVLLPMCYGLYTQFDIHPEKTVYGLQGPSGIWFFFWTQSFGRITGEIYWDNNAPWYYFCLTFLWDFMPWVPVFLAAFVYTLKGNLNHDWVRIASSVKKEHKEHEGSQDYEELTRVNKVYHEAHEGHEGSQVHQGMLSRGRKAYTEYLTLGGFVLVMILLSFSKYKLPHYIFPLFPFAAIITARYLETRLSKSGKALSFIHLILMHALYGAIVFVFLKAFPPENFILPALCIIAYFVMWFAFLSRQQSAQRIILTGCITAITFNLFLSLHLYPNLMQFQSGTYVGRMIYKDRMQNERLYFSYPDPSFSLDFYAGEYVSNLTQEEIGKVPSRSWIYTTEDCLQEIMMTDNASEYRIIQEFADYHISKLKMKFFLKESRASQLKKFFLIEKR